MNYQADNSDIDDRILFHFHGDLSLNGLFCEPLNQEVLRKSLIALRENIDTPDLSFVNWEAPVSTSNSFNSTKSPILASNVAAAELFLENYKVDVACLGNNHIGDCRNDGLVSTQDLLSRYGVEYFGATDIEINCKKLKVVKLKNKSIGFLSFVGNETNPKIDPSDDIYVNWLDDSDAYILVESCAKKVDILVVNLHWGTEYTNYPKADQITIARIMAEKGAKVIVGQHSHTLQGIEEYEGSLIIYSLGNFVFSGLKPCESIGWPKMCQESGICEVVVNDKLELSYEFIPIYSDGNGPRIDSDGAIKRLLSRRSDALNLSSFFYNIRLKANFISNWCWKLPLFLIKKQGGIVPALFRYASVRYIKLLLSNLK